jgi:hypothetical protein
MSQPGYAGSLPTAVVASRLAEAAADPSHLFWPDDVNLLEEGALSWDRVLGHRQMTDAYLLALAVRHGGRLVTFDRRISVAVVSGALDANLEVIPVGGE